MNAKIKLISSNVGICKFEEIEKQPALMRKTWS